MVIQEDGLTEKAFKRMAFAANLIVNFRVDELCEKLNPGQYPFIRMKWEHQLQLEIWKDHYYEAKGWIQDNIGISFARMGELNPRTHD